LLEEIDGLQNKFLSLTLSLSVTNIFLLKFLNNVLLRKSFEFDNSTVGRADEIILVEMEFCVVIRNLVVATSRPGGTTYLNIHLHIANSKLNFAQVVQSQVGEI
jgi:predicted O-linked N-acetylglucosamine transferase (SPINDLY family)